MNHEITLVVNGQSYTRIVEPRLLLSDFLRHELGLTGTHVGCEHGVCGACTVLLDGVAVRSCLTFAVQAGEHEVSTVESLAHGMDMEHLHPIQRGPALRRAPGSDRGADRIGKGSAHGTGVRKEQQPLALAPEERPQRPQLSRRQRGVLLSHSHQVGLSPQLGENGATDRGSGEEDADPERHSDRQQHRQGDGDEQTRAKRGHGRTTL